MIHQDSLEPAVVVVMIARFGCLARALLGFTQKQTLLPGTAVGTCSSLGSRLPLSHL